MTELITGNLPLLAGAPNGVHKLRELIFELAANGKLVTTSHDTKRVHLGEVAAFIMGQAPPGSECNKVGEGYIFVKAGEFGTLYPEVCEWTTKPLKFAKPGDVLICVVGATIGKLNLGIDCAIGRSVAAIRPQSGLLTKYLYFALIPFTLKLRKQSRGSAQGVIGKAELSSVEIRLPCEDEQIRIVAKVDELMALCDRLEAQQSDSENAHDRLVRALLDSLTQASDATDFSASWLRLAEHFHTLFTTESSIEALKQTLRQLAVMGKMVAQSPSDEPASELLHRVWGWNEKLERTLHSDRCSDDAESWFGTAAPAGWAICRVSNFAEVKLGSTPSRSVPSYWGGEIPWISSGEVANSIIRSSRERITLAGYKNSSTNMIPPGSVLIAIIGQGKTRGQSALLEIEACTNQNVAALIFNTDFIASRYVWLWAQSMYSRHRADGHGGAQPALNAKKVKAFSFPLPPTAEQHRIVAKVDQLMTLCDQLKSRLSQARQVNEQLASTLVEQAIA
ncbi:restriction endonuclease subunit S [Pseudomonas atacamensis]|uniref:restriction endonuclease subunit S n=1 Tax=Pseudomonas atacamensis TaxID=2565368 RepID=UPI001F1E95FB|nr:restriction endonuclease subunit S [Pseudomonas atacamensis]